MSSILPSGARIFCIGRNYTDHAAEMGGPAPEAPNLFLRTRDSVVVSDTDGAATVRMPSISSQFDYEGEFALIIAATARDVPEHRARDFIAGVTLFFDGSVRDVQKTSLCAGKNFDASGALLDEMLPLGAASWESYELATAVNGELRQEGHLGELIFSPERLVCYLSAILTLRAGDVIATGTPSGVGAAHKPPRWLKSGDRVEVTSSQLGPLRVLVA